MNSDLAEMMFDVLSKRIGEEVICSEWLYGQPMESEGILEEVIPFDKITISKKPIPFVGERRAIEKVVVKKTQKTVYSNPYVSGYDRKGEEVDLAQESMLGYSINRNGAYKKDEEPKSYSK